MIWGSVMTKFIAPYEGKKGVGEETKGIVEWDYGVWERNENKK